MGCMDTTRTQIRQIAITDACTAMGWWADRRQWEQLEGLFAPEVRVDYTSLNGGEPARVTRLVCLDDDWRITEVTMTARWETGPPDVLGVGEASR